jgi:hypothetical protein
MMKRFALALVLAIGAGTTAATTPALAAGPDGQLVGVVKTAERPLGVLKLVEGHVVGPQASTGVAIGVTVWVNGVSAEVGLDGRFRVIIPSEPVRSVVAYQRGTNIVVTAALRQGQRALRFHALDRAAPSIRDLLNGEVPDPGSAGATEVRSGGNDGGIRDLLNQPESGAPAAKAGSNEGDIRDLLNKPGGGASPEPPAVNGGGSDGGIRDLLNTPPVSPAH